MRSMKQSKKAATKGSIKTFKKVQPKMAKKGGVMASKKLKKY